MKWTPEAIRRARNERGWSQPELADALGVSSRTISDWERDISTPRNPTLLDRLFDSSSPTSTGPTLKQATEAELALELLARIEARRRETETGEPKETGHSQIDMRQGVTRELPASDERQHG